MSDLPDSVYDLLSYLPIDDFEVKTYSELLTRSISANYEKSEYQFAYFGVHLLFMTYIYCSVWKIGRFYKNRYEDTVLFARTYRSKEREIDLKNIKSVFEFSYIPEKDIFKFFTLVDLDPGYIGSIVELVDTRNNMAHATGKIEIYSVEEFNRTVNVLLSIAQNITENMTKPIRSWYEKMLLSWADGKFSNLYTSSTDVITEEIIKEFGFSQKELSVCSEFGVSKFNNRELYNLSPEKIDMIKQFHSKTKEICKEILGFDE